MTKLSLFGVIVSLLLLLAPARAQEISPADWQGVITSQVEAFRVHDSPAALSFAGAGFKQTFPDPEVFYQAIASMGYTPIMESRTHTFGAFRVVEANVVMQAVTFTGKDQRLYEAIYQLNLEAAGWRVAGVQMAESRASGCSRKAGLP